MANSVNFRYNLNTPKINNNNKEINYKNIKISSNTMKSTNINFYNDLSNTEVIDFSPKLNPNSSSINIPRNNDNNSRINEINDTLKKANDLLEKVLEEISGRKNWADKIKDGNNNGNLFSEFLYWIAPNIVDSHSHNGRFGLSGGIVVTIDDDTITINVTSECMTYTYKDGLCVGIEYGNGRSSQILYNENGLCTGIQYDNGIVAQIQYDSSGNAYDLKYYYNNNGNIEPISIFGNYNIDNTQFGGNQMDFKNNVDKLLQDPIILSLLRESFPDATMEDYELYLNALCSVGCGYTAFINTIFVAFEGKEDKFQEIFGFPMYSINERGEIDFNYEYLILELFNYCWADKGYTIQELYGDIGLNAEDEALSGNRSTKIVSGQSGDSNTNAYNNPYNNSFTSFIQWLFEKYHIGPERTPYDINKIKREIHYGDAEWQEIFDELRLDNVDPSTIFYKNDTKAILNFISEILKEDKTVIIFAKDFPIYDYPDLNCCNNSVGAHSMIVIGTTEEGIIVSSWGKQYIIKTEDFDKIYGINDFYYYDI